MDAAVLSEPGRGRLAEFSRRTGVLAAIMSLHVLVIGLLAMGSPDSHSRLDHSVLEAEVIPLERSLPPPPPLAPVAMQAITPIDMRPQPLSFETPIQQITETQPVETEPLHDGVLPVISSAPPAGESSPIVGPRPISGPRASYPVASVKAKESGKVSV